MLPLRIRSPEATRDRPRQGDCRRGPELTPQEPVLFDQGRDCLPLSAVQPAGEHAQHHLQRREVDHEAELHHGTSLKNVGRELEHYGARKAVIA